MTSPQTMDRILARVKDLYYENQHEADDEDAKTNGAKTFAISYHQGYADAYYDLYSEIAGENLPVPRKHMPKVTE